MQARARTPGADRRSGRRRRRAPLITLARIAGLALMILTVGSIAWLVTTDEFMLDTSRIEVSGMAYTDQAQVVAALDIDPSLRNSIFLVPTQRIERALAALPQIASAKVSAVLPDRLVVDITERSPVAIVRRDGWDYRIDADGVVLGRSEAGLPADDALPVFEDGRSEPGYDIEVGGQIEGTDLSAMLQLLAIAPLTLDSTASALAVSADDEEGYVIVATPTGWRAVFGHYTPTLRPPDIIGRQVQCLRSLLADEEDSIDTIYLAPLDERCGTYLPRDTPSPSPSASARM